MIKEKRGQQKLSFGMIFSIILIIIFISFAVWGVTKLIGTKENVQIEKFPSDLQDDVTEVWKSTHGSQDASYDLPDSVVEICFVKSEYDNLEIMEEAEGLDKVRGSHQIENIDINSTVGEREKLCIENTDGSVEMVLEKETDNPLVIIKKNNTQG